MSPSICNLRTLRELHLSCCELTAIDPAITQLRNLEELDLSKNWFFPEVCSVPVGPYSRGFAWCSTVVKVGVCVQVPQELAGLTPLTRLCLLDCGAGVASGVHPDGKHAMVPKMRVSEQNCRFLLHFPFLANISLSVTKEEKAALELAGFLTKLQVGKSSDFCFFLGVCEEFRKEGDFFGWA